jgi:hypothetical protein
VTEKRPVIGRPPQPKTKPVRVRIVDEEKARKIVGLRDDAPFPVVFQALVDMAEAQRR